MKILIVDDDKTTVDALVQEINWADLGFDSPFQAYSVSGAKDIIVNHTINLLLCDIEMPRENGINLLEWIRTSTHPIECIFLTNHLEFHYAQKALKLDSFDYLSKASSTLEIELSIKKAVAKIHKVKHSNVMINQFSHNIISDILYGKVHFTLEVLTKIITKYNFTFKTNQEFIPLLYVFSKHEHELNSMTYSEADFIILNVLNELFSHNSRYYLFSQSTDTEYYYVILIQVNEGSDTSSSNSMKQLIDYIEVSSSTAYHFFMDSFRFTPTIYLNHNTIHLFNLKKWYQDAIQLDALNTVYRERLLYADELQVSDKNHALVLNIPEHWEMLFRHNKIDQLLIEIRQYLNQNTFGHTIPPALLNQLYYDFTQLITSILKEKNIPSHMIFEDKKLCELAKYASHSLIGLVKWISYIVPLAANQITFTTRTQTPEQLMINFIHKNYMNKIGRTEIVEVTYLSPSYAARIFKKNTNYSLNDYLAKYRIDKAKELMLNSALCISEISSMVGFEQFSYFSTTFRSIEGMSPREYRRLHTKD